MEEINKSVSVLYKVGKVKYYYEKSNLMIVDLKADLGVGEMIKVESDEYSFIQKVNTIKVENSSIQSAKSGMTVALVAERKVIPGSNIFKVV